MSDIISSGNKQDKWTIKVTELINLLFNTKQGLLIEGAGITIKDNKDGTFTISSNGSSNLYGTNNPLNEEGKDGSIYMKHDDSNIQDLFGKIDGEWMKLIGTGGGGGGGSGTGLTCDILLENTNYIAVSGTSNVEKEYTLKDSIDDYDAVIVSCWTYNFTDNTHDGNVSMIIPSKDYYKRATTTNPIGYVFSLNGSTNSSRRSLYFGFINNKTIKTVSIRSDAGNTPVIDRIYGLNFGRGSGDINDVRGDGKSVVENGIAEINGKQNLLPFQFVINEQDNGIDIIYERN